MKYSFCAARWTVPTGGAVASPAPAPQATPLAICHTARRHFPEDSNLVCYQNVTCLTKTLTVTTSALIYFFTIRSAFKDKKKRFFKQPVINREIKLSMIDYIVSKQSVQNLDIREVPKIIYTSVSPFK